LPTGTATFGNSNITSITSLGGSDIFISEMRFSLGAPAYNFLVSGGNFFIIRGTGIVNNSSFAPSFAVTNSSVLLFFGNATAGDANITATNSGQVQFASSSTGGTATITANGGAIIFFLDQSSAPQAHLIINSGGTLDLSFLTSGAISLGSIQGAGTFSFGSAEVTVGSAVAFGNSTEVSGIIADGGANGGVGASLIKAGTGTLILTGNNTYTGGTTISQGTLQLGNGGTTGSILGNVSDNAIFAIDRSDTFTFSGNISGTGSFQRIGPGTTILSGNNTYLGTTTVMSGTLQLGNGGASGSIVGNVIDNGIFAINRSDAFTFGGVISGTGSFQQLGTGTTILTAVNSYSGGTTISAGVLNVSADHNLGAASGGLTLNGGTLQFGSTFNLANTRTITLNGGGGTFDTDGFNTTISQRITGVGGLIKTGPGILTLSGSDSYSGGTVINAGILLVNNAQALGLGNVVLNGGILEADLQPVNAKGNYTQNAAGTLLLQVAGAGSGQYDFLNVSGNANLGGHCN
jgi:autotransporter-associated beta strand protein